MGCGNRAISEKRILNKKTGTQNLGCLSFYFSLLVAVKHRRLFVSESFDGIFKVVCCHEIYGKVEFLAQRGLVAQGVLDTELLFKALDCQWRTGAQHVNQLVKFCVELGQGKYLVYKPETVASSARIRSQKITISIKRLYGMRL